MKKIRIFLSAFIICTLLAACGAGPAAENAVLDYGIIKSDFSGMTPEVAAAYLAIIDDITAHLGCDEAEAADGEYLHGGFVRDWDNDGIPELCLLLRTSPRDSGGWDGTPVYGWNPPTIYLYTFRNGRAVQAFESDLYFATAGRECAIAALICDEGVKCIRWDCYSFENETRVDYYELADGSVQKREAPADLIEASKGSETAQAFLGALGAGKVQLLLYNSSGDAKIEGEANARELRAAIAAKAS